MSTAPKKHLIMKEAKPTQRKREIFQVEDGFRFGIGFIFAILIMPFILSIISLVGWILLVIFGSI